MNKEKRRGGGSLAPPVRSFVKSPAGAGGPASSQCVSLSRRGVWVATQMERARRTRERGKVSRQGASTLAFLFGRHSTHGPFSAPATHPPARTMSVRFHPARAEPPRRSQSGGRAHECAATDRESVFASLLRSLSPLTLPPTPTQGEDIAAATAELDSMQGEKERRREGEKETHATRAAVARRRSSLLSLTHLSPTLTPSQSPTSSPWSWATRRRRRRRRTGAKAR